MNLKYKIIWIDDRPDDIEDEVNCVNDYIVDEGFTPLINVIEDDDADIDTIFSDPQLDIIITDFNLSTIPAREIIEKARMHHRFIEIILYTQKVGIDIKSTAQDFQGIFYDNRDGLVDTIKKVIGSSIRRSQDICTMRGLVISEAIDIENQIEDVILLFHESKEKELAQLLLDGDDGIDFGKKIAFLNRCLNEIVKDCNVIANGGSKNQEAILQANSILEELAPIKQLASKLEKEVCLPRNMLAHVEHHDDNGHASLKSLRSGYKEIRIDSDWCKDIRKQLLKHVSNLNKSKSLIKKWHIFNKWKIDISQ